MLFDYGGVMNSLPANGNISFRLAEVTGLEKEEAFSLIKDVWTPYSKGVISEREVWSHIENKSKKSIPQSKRGIWNKWQDAMPSAEMLQLIAELKADGYAVGLVSNSFPPTAEDIRKNNGYSMFDFTVISCDVGFVKPEKEIYEIALDKLGKIKPEEVIFIDDQERCIEGARNVGLRVVLAENPAQIKTSIEQIIRNH